MTPATQLIESLAALRRQWRQRVLLEAVVWIGIAMLLSILAGQLITSLFGTTSATVMFMRGLGYLLILGVVVRNLVRPLLRRTSDERFALYVEERAPALRQSLLSAVHELHAPVAERASPSLTARLVDRTLAVMQPLQRNRALERPRVRRAVRSLGVIAVAVILLVTIGPRQLRQTARQIFAPWSVAEAATPKLAVRVRPGNAAIPRGAAVDVKASLDGFAADGAELVYRSDSAVEWTRLPMARDSIAGTFTSRVFDLVHATEYFVDANGIRSPTYTLRVTDLPALSSHPGEAPATPRASWLQPSGSTNFPGTACLPRETNFLFLPVLHCVAAAARCSPPDPHPSDHRQGRDGRDLAPPKGDSSWQTSAPSPHRTTASPARFAP